MILEKIQLLHAKTFDDGLPANAYKWEIGVKAMQDLADEQAWELNPNYTDTVHTLYGIPIEIKYDKDDHVVKLWRRVGDEFD